ncbi:hypothetical protein [Sphingomonas faeni]|uniref:hypothetical protein n=1 Tax=Sphingomonas faeni TaxID=185950 RepID=UPI003349F903
MIDDENVRAANDVDERTYLQMRAQWHRNRADGTSDSSARLLHTKFATLYEARAQS